jgi:hypothetical protein
MQGALCIMKSYVCVCKIMAAQVRIQMCRFSKLTAFHAMLAKKKHAMPKKCAMQCYLQ